MTFNEMNTIENALRDHLAGRPVSEQTGMVAEETTEYIAGSQDLKWKYVHGENLILHGKQPQDVFVDTWLKEALCRLNKPLAANPDLAGVLLESGLQRTYPCQRNLPGLAAGACFHAPWHRW
ncbi:hypothetical protein [uncultured Desulfobacter sp.]|uniref:hypothetical protein n=1 Tax=uncultured Desulfobacter sp. TaxID=240139 RepID=UPI002AAAE15E|nr:hypothetical protein [uncultured Desulfobacter sp.]